MQFSKQISPIPRDYTPSGYQQKQIIGNIPDSPDNIYLNCVIDHDEATYNFGTLAATGPTCYLTKDNPASAEYNATKDQIIVQNASDYYLSVIRMTIPLNLCPIAIMQVVPNQISIGLNDPNLTPYIIGISYLGVTYSVNLLYVSNQLGYPAPTQNQTLQVITPYYYVFSYTQIVDMINVGLNSAYVNSGLAALLVGYIAPHFILDPVTNLLSLIVPQHFTDIVAPLAVKPIIFMNNALETYLDNFNLQFIGYNIPTGREVDFKLVRSNENQYYPAGVTVPASTVPPVVPANSLYYKFVQDYPCIQYWATLRRIVLTSSMPVNKEYLPAAINQNNYVNVNTAGVNVSYPILTDIIPNISTDLGVAREIIYYQPQGQYRLVDLMSTGSIQNINIKILFEDTNGNFYPLLI